MSCSDLLAVVCGRPADERVLRTAAALARRFGAVARVVLDFPAASTAFVALSGVSAAPIAPTMLAQVQEAEREIAAAAAESARRAAAAEAVAFGPGEHGPRLVLQLGGALPWLTVEHALPLADLVLVDRDTARGRPPAGPIFNDALIVARAPVLVLAEQVDFDLSCVCVAWDGGLHAGRAVRGALPLLRSAERVVVLQATRGLREALRESPSSPPEALQRYLHRHGVARSEAMRVDDEIGGPGVTEMLQALEVRLLVAGAFGRSRLREMVFGGSTRAFLEAVDGPSLLLGH